MNLIEKYGSYDAAKAKQQELSKIAADPQLLLVGKIIKEIGEIEIALLEYRRQHNIYEVGDKVVIESYGNTCISCGRPSQYSIGDLMIIHNLDGNVISDDDYNFIDYRDVRHATDAEIKVGRRL